MSERPIRTVLFVPGDRPERFDKAVGSGADAVVVDLEDAVAPDRKDVARAATTRAVGDGDVLPYVRVNGVGAPGHDDDVTALAELARSVPLPGLLVPKAESPGELSALAARFPPQVEVVALIETARGWLEASRIAAVERVTRLAFGAHDLAADLGAEESAMDAARFQVVVASRAAGIAAPWDSPVTGFADPGVVGESAAHAKRLGYGAKLCIHPAQIEPVRAAFLPTEVEIAWARRVLEADEGGASQVDGAMVDKPVIARARRILAEHETHREVS